MTEKRPILPGITGPIWRDRDGDPWEELPDGLLRNVADDGDPHPGAAYSRGYVKSVWGSLTRETPLTWDLPPEPGPEVRAVRTQDGQIWCRSEGHHVTGGWQAIHNDRGARPRWHTLLCGMGQLTDATAEVEAQDGATA